MAMFIGDLAVVAIERGGEWFPQGSWGLVYVLCKSALHPRLAPRNNTITAVYLTLFSFTNTFGDSMCNKIKSAVK